jgi:hypothetical protein
LRARPPSVKCDEHGVMRVRSEPHSRFTQMFERFAIDVLLESSVMGAARILRLSWDEAWHLAERAVKTRTGSAQQAAAALDGCGREGVHARSALRDAGLRHRARDASLRGTGAQAGEPGRLLQEGYRLKSARASRPLQWTCGTRTWRRWRGMLQKRARRSSTTAHGQGGGHREQARAPRATRRR